MCSSPAYPTLAPLGGSTTRDLAVFCGPVSVPGEDVSHLPSKGMLPQLIDVLHALTEGQELLSRKVRDATVEQGCHSVPVVERCRRAESSDSDARRTSVVTSPNASVGMRSERTSDKTELGARESTTVDDSGNGSSPEPNMGASAAPVIATVHAPSPSIPQPPIVADAASPDDLSRDTSVRADELNSAQSGEMTSESLNRDYNFFDELDARLADLPDPADQSGA